MDETPKIGQEAPDFTLKDEQGKDVTLSALRGQTVVLVFFPLAFSGVCEGEMCSIRDMWSDFEGADATVFGISRDSVYSLRAWKEAKGLKNRFLADMKGTVAKAYGCWNEAIGIAERLTVVVDKEGKVAWTDRSSGIGVARDQREAVQAAAVAR